MSIKLNYKYIAVLALLAVLSCAKTEETYTPLPGEELVLRLCPAGELLQVSDEPLAKAGLPEGTLYSVSVYEQGNAYAHGVFDNTASLSLRLLAGETYTIQVKAVRGGVSGIDHTDGNYYGTGLLDNTFHYYAGDKTDEALYGAVSNIGTLENLYLADTYYGALTVTPAPGTVNLTVNLYRMMHTLHIRVVGFENGDGTLAFSQAEYLPGTAAVELSFASPESSVSAVINTDFGAVLSAIDAGGDYSRSTSFSAEYTSTVFGSAYAKTLLDAQPFTVYRNRVNTLTYNLRHNYLDPPVPEAVDLGLSVKWASFNIGATKPEGYGDYYAWGEVEPYYSSQDPLTWKEGKASGYVWASYKWCMGLYNTMTKYCNDSFYVYGYNGFTDTKTVLDPEDDVAHVTLGGNWRMPTDSEWTELRNNCTWTWTDDYNGTGKAGRIVTSNMEGYTDKSIFLPVAGNRYDTTLYFVGSGGYYWSSSLNTDRSYSAWYLYFDFGGVNRYFGDRCYGFSVRPVLDADPTEKVGEIDGEW